MVNLKEYREFWEDVANVVDEITSLLPVTIDDQMGKKIQGLPKNSVTLFMFPPVSESTARTADNYGEKNNCVIFLLEKFDPLRSTSFEILEKTQPALDRVKALLVKKLGAPCSPMKLDVSSIEIAPETELYGTFAGWSIAFNLLSY